MTEIDEAQMMRMVAHPSYISQVKEEFFFINDEDVA